MILADCPSYTPSPPDQEVTGQALALSHRWERGSVGCGAFLCPTAGEGGFQTRPYSTTRATAREGGFQTRPYSTTRRGRGRRVSNPAPTARHGASARLRRVSNPPLRHDEVRGVWTVAEVAGVLVDGGLGIGGGDEGEPLLLLVVNCRHVACPGRRPCRCICRRGRCSRRCAVRRSRRLGDRVPDSSGKGS